MPCSDLLRSESSVPPKKSLSWRLDSTTSPGEQNTSSRQSPKDSMPDSRENVPVPMGSYNEQLNSCGNHSRAIQQKSPANNDFREDLPLDFSLKKDSNLRYPSQSPALPQNGSFPGYGAVAAINTSSRDLKNTMSNGCSNGKPLNNEHRSTEGIVSEERNTNSNFPENNVSRHHLTVPKPEPVQIPSYSSSVYSSNSPESSILKDTLTRISPGVVPVNINNPQILANLAQSPYSGFTAVYPPAAAFNSIINDPLLFPPSDLVQSTAMTYLGAPINMLPTLPPISPQSTYEVRHSGARRNKKERPFKIYSLNDDIPLPLQLGFSPPPLDIPEPQPSGSRSVPRQRISPNNVSASSSSSVNSDQAGSANDTDSNHNVPHSSVPNSSPPSESRETADNSSRKRKPVADSEKDENYWKKREKNNLAAKRSREARRIKEDQIAEHAMYYKNGYYELGNRLRLKEAQFNELRAKCSALENTCMNMMAEIRVLKQAALQKRCDECGSRFSE